MSASFVVEQRGIASRRARVGARVARVAVRPVLQQLPRWLPHRLPDLVFLDRAGALLPAPKGTTVRSLEIGSCLAEWVAAPAHGGEGTVVLYFHGGLFMVGGLRTHRRLVARVSAAACGARVLNVRYRKLPQTRFADILGDVLYAYRWLLDSGQPPERIVVAGDSAGGFLAFSAVLAARDVGLPIPAGIVGLSPLLDLDSSARQAHPNAAREPLLPANLSKVATRYVTVDGKLDQALSPVNADLSGLPPVLLQVGSTEALLADAETMAARLTAADVPCQLQVWDRQIHDFQLAADILPEARTAIADIGNFIAAVTGADGD